MTAFVIVTGLWSLVSAGVAFVQGEMVPGLIGFGFAAWAALLLWGV